MAATGPLIVAPDEHLFLPRPEKGWRGNPVCEIELARLPDAWLWSVSFALHGGDFWGHASPLWDVPARRAASRSDALAAASEWLRIRMEPRAAAYPDARAILGWLDARTPVQLDLFTERAAA